MTTAAVTSKGQITIPAEVREDLHLKKGDRVIFLKGERGEYILKAKRGRLQDAKGLIQWSGKPATIEEMNEAIARGWAGELRSMTNSKR